MSGLLQEADEIAIGPAIVCPECGKETPRHTYCGNCGASLKALPRNRQHYTISSGQAVGDLVAPHETVPTPPDLTGAPSGVATAISADAAIASAAQPRKRGWLDQRAILGLFAVLLLGAVLIAAVIAFAQGQRRDQPPCPDPDLPCVSTQRARGGARHHRSRRSPSGRHPFGDWQLYRGHGHGVLRGVRPGTLVDRQAGRGPRSRCRRSAATSCSSSRSGRRASSRPDSVAERRARPVVTATARLRGGRPSRRTLLGEPILGYRDGVGGLFSGTLDTSQGPTLDITVAVVAATDDTITVAAVLITPVALPISEDQRSRSATSS